MATHVEELRLSTDELVELKGLIEERTHERLKLLRDGIRIWDYSIICLHMVSGIVD